MPTNIEKDRKRISLSITKPFLTDNSFQTTSDRSHQSRQQS